ncbi:nuclear transport factor 2 family protein [Burkholderia sp. SIMBA_062]|uniref:nuclear transport factor 2 family protein n=1 Tax=Burkholderia sp. SIMBA_062 TaxID=3085803 RepID=UPI00397DD824
MVTDTATTAFEFATSLYEVCDSMDEQRFASFLTEDCRFVYANSEPVVGRNEAAAYVAGFMALIAGIKHNLVEVWQCDDVIVSRMNVTYTRKDQTKLTVPAMTVWRMRGQLVAEYLIYVDVSPLFAS